MMTAELSKRHASAFLSEQGFLVEEIEVVPDEERADLRAVCSGDEYVIEAKMRTEQQAWRDTVDTARREGFATTSRPVDPWNAISSMIRKAHDQLVATPASKDAFRILWVAALHDDDNFVLNCVEKRLFGRALMSVVKSMSLQERPTTRHCYFHSHADFRRFRTLDAAVLATTTDVRLCVNTFGSNVSRLRDSRLYHVLRQAVRDPEIAERNGTAFVMGDDYRPDETGRAAWAYIRQKYGLLTSKMTEANFRALVSVPSQLIGSEPER
jgi:hypothetical protein